MIYVEVALMQSMFPNIDGYIHCRLLPCLLGGLGKLLTQDDKLALVQHKEQGCQSALPDCKPHEVLHVGI